MIIDKVPWVDHAGTPLFSVDVHPSGGKLATCGSDQKVKIWNTAPILEEKKEKDAATPRLLATLTDHLGAVNAVQFSHNGRHIASGADDQVVLVHELHAGRGQAAFGSGGGEANVENWKMLHAFRGHSRDVVSLAWAPDDTLLASASLDNTIMIWSLPEARCVRVLRGHEGFVKGVAWDPLGKYLASQGDDAAIIWRCEDWQQVARFTDAMREQCSMAFHYRLSWSPDGQVLALANGSSQGKPIVPLLRRNDWTSDHSYVGHKAPVSVTCYNPRMFFPRQQQDSDQAFYICALGSHDRQTSLWSSAEPSPIATIKKIFKQGVMGACWTPDGYNLFLASYDGTLACARFEPQDLGRQLSDADMRDLMKQLYGNIGNRPRVLVESAEQLLLEAAAPVAAGAAAGPSGQDPFSRLNSRVMPAGATTITSLQPAKPAADGVRRIQAQPVKENTAPAAGSASAAAAAAAAAWQPAARIQPVQVSRTVAATPVVTPAAPAAAVAAGAGAAAAGTGRQRDPDVPPTKRQHTAPLAATAAAALAAREGLAQVPHPAAAAAAAPLAAGSRLLQPPPVTELVTCDLGDRVNALTGIRDRITLSAKNTTSRLGKPVAEIICQAGGVLQWRDTISGQVLHLLGSSSSFTAVATAAGELLVYSLAGRRVLAPLFLGHPACFAATNSDGALLLLTADALLRMYDLRQQRCQLRLDISHLLAGGSRSVDDVRLAASGAPLLTLSSGQTLMYHQCLDDWMVCADSSSLFSAYHSALPLPGQLERPGLAAADAISAALRQPAAMQQQQERAHLESRVALALCSRSAPEWRRQMIMYVRNLAYSSDEARMREVFSELLGPLRSQPSPQDAPARYQALGIDTRAFLKNEVLREVGRTRQHQRLVNEFLEMIAETERAAQQQQQQQQQQQR